MVSSNDARRLKTNMRNTFELLNEYQIGIKGVDVRVDCVHIQAGNGQITVDGTVGDPEWDQVIDRLGEQA